MLCPCRVCLWCAGLPGVCLNEGGEGVCCLFRGTVFYVFYLSAGCNGMEVPLLPGMCVILIRNRS